MPLSSRLTWNGDLVDELAREGAAAGLGIGAEHVLGVSRQRVPLEEATLERSGGTDVDADELVASVFYDTPYAVRQHEELDWEHDEGREAKYLENPLTEEADTVVELVAAEIRRSLR